MFSLSFFLTLGGALLFYLASPNQGWLKRRLAPRTAIPAAVFLEAAALGLWGNLLSPVAGFFAWLSVLMLLLGLFPFLSLFTKRARP